MTSCGPFADESHCWSLPRQMICVPPPPTVSSKWITPPALIVAVWTVKFVASIPTVPGAVGGVDVWPPPPGVLPQPIIARAIFFIVLRSFRMTSSVVVRENVSLFGEIAPAWRPKRHTVLLLARHL